MMNKVHIVFDEFIKFLTDIDAAKTTTFEYQTEGIYCLTADQCMKSALKLSQNCLPSDCVDHKGSQVSKSFGELDR